MAMPEVERHGAEEFDFHRVGHFGFAVFEAFRQHDAGAVFIAGDGVADVAKVF